jgi:hypothetical protein
MQITRFIRMLVPLMMVGLVGIVIGCSGQVTSPPEKGAGKQIAAERKAERKERAEARSEARAAMKESMKETMKGRMKGRGPR